MTNKTKYFEGCTAKLKNKERIQLSWLKNATYIHCEKNIRKYDGYFAQVF